MAYSFDDAGRRRAARDAVLRDVRATAASTTRAGPRSPATARPGCSADDARRSTTTSGSCTTPARLDPGARPRRGAAGEARRAAAAVPDRGDASTTSCRWTTAASSASTPTWPAGPQLIHGNSQLLFGGMGRLTENSVVNLKNKSHAVTARGRGARRRRRGRDHRPGRRLRRLEPVRQGRQAGATATTCFGLQPLQDRRRAARSRPASTRCGMEFAYDGGGLAQGRRRSRSTSTATKVGEGRVDAHRADGLLRPTRRPTSAATAARRSATTTARATARFTGTRRAGSRSTSARTPRTPTT